MASSISNLVDSIVERIHKIKSKNEHDDKKMRNVRNQIRKTVSAVLNTKTLNMI